MKSTFTIAIADGDGSSLASLERGLRFLGHRICCATRSATRLIEQCREKRPDLVIVDVACSDGDGLAAAHEICRDRPVPIIMTSARFAEKMTERVEAEHVLSWLLKPISQDALIPAVALAVFRFVQLQQLRDQAAQLQDALSVIGDP